MNAHVFLVAFVLGAGVLALWVDVRFPRLAPRRIQLRLVAAAVALVLLSVMPVTATTIGLFAMLLPALALTFLTLIWLLHVAADPAAHI